jgi:archaeosine-15-forming tRNA-guanine transglycosylase
MKGRIYSATAAASRGASESLRVAGRREGDPAAGMGNDLFVSAIVSAEDHIRANIIVEAK